MKKRLLLLIGFTGSLFAMEPETTEDQKGKEKVTAHVQEITLGKEVKYIVTSPQGTFAFVHFKDDSGALFNRQTRKTMRTFKKCHKLYEAPCAQFSSDEKLVSLQGIDTTFEKDGRTATGLHWLLLNLTSDHGKIVEAEKEYPVMDHQFSPNGNSLMLSLAHNNKKVFYKFNNNGIQFNPLVLELKKTESFSFSPDGDFLYLTQMVEDQPKSHLFHLASSNIIDLEEFEGDVHGAFTQNNKLQVVQAGKLRIIDPNDYGAIKVFNAAYPKRTKQEQRVNKPEECQKCTRLSQREEEKTGLETQLSSLQQKCKESQQKNMAKAKRGLIRSMLSFVGSGCVTAYGAWSWLKGDQENKTQYAMLTGLGSGLTVASGYRTIQNLIDYKNAQKALAK